MAKDVILEADLGGIPITPDELAAIPDFSAIRKEIWGKFPGAITRKVYKPGEIIMREGENGTTAFYVLSGTVDMKWRRKWQGQRSCERQRRTATANGNSERQQRTATAWASRPILRP